MGVLNGLLPVDFLIKRPACPSVSPITLNQGDNILLTGRVVRGTEMSRRHFAVSQEDIFVVPQWVSLTTKPFDIMNSRLNYPFLTETR